MKIIGDTVSAFSAPLYGMRGAGLARVMPEALRCEVCGNLAEERIRLERNPLGMMVLASFCGFCGAATGETVEPLCSQYRAHMLDPYS